MSFTNTHRTWTDVGCPDLADWYLAHRLPVIDIGSRDWERAREAVLAGLRALRMSAASGQDRPCPETDAQIGRSVFSVKAVAEVGLVADLCRQL